jgi:hypothetical protein
MRILFLGSVATTTDIAPLTGLQYILYSFLVLLLLLTLRPYRGQANDSHNFTTTNNY